MKGYMAEWVHNIIIIIIVISMCKSPIVQRRRFAHRDPTTTVQ